MIKIFVPLQTQRETEIRCGLNPKSGSLCTARQPCVERVTRPSFGAASAFSSFPGDVATSVPDAGLQSRTAYNEHLSVLACFLPLSVLSPGDGLDKDQAHKGRWRANLRTLPTARSGRMSPTSAPPSREHAVEGITRMQSARHAKNSGSFVIDCQPASSGSPWPELLQPCLVRR